MATAKQIEANRRNAQKSTGPRTAEGKAASKFNALNHGLRAEHLALPHENAEEVQAFVDAIIEAAAPRDAMEAELACEIATLSWKLRRAERYEHALLSKRMYAKLDGLAGKDREETAWNYELAAFDDDQDGQRRRRYITGIRNQLARARKELRLWVEAHPDPEPAEEPEPEVVEEAQDTPEIGFVRQEPIPAPAATVAPTRPSDEVAQRGVNRPAPLGVPIAPVRV